MYRIVAGAWRLFLLLWHIFALVIVRKETCYEFNWQGDDWVDLSTNNLSTIGQILMDGELSLGDFVEDDEDDVGGTSEGGQQVIQIDDSLPSVAGTVPFESLSLLKAENEKLRAQLAEAEAAAEQARAAETARLAAETKAAADRAAEAVAQAEAALEGQRVRAALSEAEAETEMARHAERAAAAEALCQALRTELGQVRDAHAGTVAGLTEELKQAKAAEAGAVATAAMSGAAASAAMGLRRELAEAKRRGAAAEASYEELLKTMAGQPAAGQSTMPLAHDLLPPPAADPAAPGSTPLSREDQSVLATCCANAAAVLTQFDEAALAGGEDRTAGGGGSGDQGSSVAATALVMRQLTEALSEVHNCKVAIDRFAVGEVAMFFPIPRKPGEGAEYVAFSARCSKSRHVKHFLAEESKGLIGQLAHFKDAYVLGRIVHRERCVAAEQNRRLCLKAGQEYFLLTVSALPLE